MFRAFSLSLAQLGDRAFLKVLAKSLALTLVIFIALGFALWRLFDWLIAWLGWPEDGGFAELGAVALTILGTWFLFRVVAMGVINIFADDIVAAVERKHYPEALARAISPPLALQGRVALGSVGRAIGWNLLATPLYILLLVTGIGTLALVILVNGWLLSRDLSELVLARHRPPIEWRDWMRARRGVRYLLGLVAALLFVLPVVNLLAPLLGAAMATHLFHGGRR